MATKALDCVEMKRRASLRIYEDTKDMNFQEKVVYWREKSEAMMRRRVRAGQPDNIGSGRPS